MTKMTLPVSFQGGALEHAGGIDMVFDETPHTWPPDFIQIDYADARWSYRRVPGERTQDGDYVFRCTGRDRLDWIDPELWVLDRPFQ